MVSYVVYDTLLGEDLTRRRKIRVDKHPSLEAAKQSAQMRYIRFARGPLPENTGKVECITVETQDGQIVYELPETAASPN